MDFRTTPLTFIFNLRHVHRVFPKIWKITPIKKSNDWEHINNYRLIALLSVPKKIFASMIKEEI